MSPAEKNDIPKTSAPAQRALDSIGVKNLSDLEKFTEAEIRELHGMGPKALGILKIALHQRGLTFKKNE